jgi:hypothetical protein
MLLGGDANSTVVVIGIPYAASAGEPCGGVFCHAGDHAPMLSASRLGDSLCAAPMLDVGVSCFVTPLTLILGQQRLCSLLRCLAASFAATASPTGGVFLGLWLHARHPLLVRD